MRALDTNVLVRFFVDDADDAQVSEPPRMSLTLVLE